MEIVCNSAIQHADVGGAFVARAVPAWVGCVFSNGEECTEDIAKALVASVADAGTKPPLLLDHVWSAEGVIGRMTSCTLDEDGKVVCEFAVYSDDSAEKIRSGEWESISVTFEDKTYRMMECSIVAIPAVDGAKIEMAETANAEAKPDEAEAPAEADPKAEDVPAEDKPDEAPAEAKPADEVAPAEDAPAEDKSDAEVAREEFMAARAEAKPDEDKPADEAPAEAEDNECKREPVANSAIVVENAKLKAQVNDLRAELAKVKGEMVYNAQVQRANALVDGWVAGGMTLPAQAQAEKDFVVALMQETGKDLLDNYISIKNGMGNVGSAILGRRKSIANARPMTDDERLAQLNESIVAERLERRK